MLSAPIVYSVLLPFMLIDLWVTLYQRICFPIYGIARVRRADYIAVDRWKLAYLNTIEKANCDYCGYVNGLLSYVREVSARTEQYWCPIKHARRVRRLITVSTLRRLRRCRGYKRELPVVARRAAGREAAVVLRRGTISSLPAPSRTSVPEELSMIIRGDHFLQPWSTGPLRLPLMLRSGSGANSLPRSGQGGRVGAISMGSVGPDVRGTGRSSRRKHLGISWGDQIVTASFTPHWGSSFGWQKAGGTKVHGPWQTGSFNWGCEKKKSHTRVCRGPARNKFRIGLPADSGTAPSLELPGAELCE
jgi:hypothetical protein